MLTFTLFRYLHSFKLVAYDGTSKKQLLGCGSTAAAEPTFLPTTIGKYRDNFLEIPLIHIAPSTFHLARTYKSPSIGVYDVGVNMSQWLSVCASAGVKKKTVTTKGLK